MDINKDIQEKLANSDKTISKEWIEEAQKKYPYFTLPALLYLHRNKDSEGFDEDILARLSISSPDRKALYTILGENAERFVSFYAADAYPQNQFRLP